jgi:hypothetical protein
LGEEARAELIHLFRDGVIARKHAIADAKAENIVSFPMDLAVPFVAIFYGTQFCQNVHLSEDFIQFDFSL